MDGLESVMGGYMSLSLGAPMSVAGLGSGTLVLGLGAAAAWWGTLAHSVGILPQGAFDAARNIGIHLPPMPHRG